MDKIELGKKIREARNKAGYTQETLAEKADMGVMYLGEIERGVKMPSMKSFIKIIEALDISADYILRDELRSGKAYVYDEIKYDEDLHQYILMRIALKISKFNI